MALQNGIIYNTVIKKCVDYVNKGWKTNYKVEDVALIDLSTTFIGVHFNKDDYSKLRLS